MDADVLGDASTDVASIGTTVAVPSSLNAVSPPRIPSRSLQKLVATWDASREKEVLVLSVKEALTTIKHHASSERWAATERLYELLSAAGNTRRKASVMNLRESVLMGNAVEGEIAKWESVERRCDQLLREVEEFVGLFPDKYQSYLKQLVQEVASASWDLGPPHTSPWGMVPSIFLDAAEVSVLAAEDVAAAHSQGQFSAVEACEWSSAPCRKAGEYVSATRKLNISCVAVDNTEPVLTTVFVGTKNGDVMSFPVEAMLQQQSASGAATSSDRPPSATSSAMNSSVASLDIALISAADNNNQQQSSSSSLIHVLHQLLQTRNSAVRNKVQDLGQLSPTMDGVRVYQGHRFEVLDLSIVSFTGPEYEKMKVIVSCAADKVVRVSAVATGALIGIYSDSTSIVPNAQYFPLLNCLVQGNFHGLVEAWDFRTSTMIAPLMELDQPVTQVHMCQTAGGNATRSTGMFVGTRRGHIYKVNINIVELDGTDRRRVNSQNPVTYEYGLLGDPSAPLPPELSPVALGQPSLSPIPADEASTTMNSRCGSSQSTHKSGIPALNVNCEYVVQVEPNVADGERSQSLSPLDATTKPQQQSDQGQLPKLVLGGHMHAIVKMATLGPFLFSADSSGKVVQWDRDRRLFVRKYHSHTDTITSLVVSGDGFMFTSSLDGLICVWSVTNGQLLSKLNRHFNVVAGIVLGYTPSQRPAASAAKKQSLLLGVDTAQSTPTSTPLSVSPNAGQKRRKSLIPPSAASGVSSPAAGAGGKSKLKNTGGNGAGSGGSSSTNNNNIFPEIPMSFRKTQGGARECVTLDIDRKAASSSSPTAAMKVTLISFARDESAIAWDVAVDRSTADLGATFSTHR